MDSAAIRPSRDVASEPPTSTLLERIRTGVIGDDEVLEGPYGPRRVSAPTTPHRGEVSEENGER